LIKLFKNRQTQQMMSPDYRVPYISPIEII